MDEADVRRDGDRFGDVPARLVEQQRGVDARREVHGEAVEEDLHGCGAGLRQDEREGVVGAGAHRAVDPGRGVTAVGHASGPNAALEPNPRAASFLADAGLVLAPELQLGIGMAPGDLGQRRRKAPFLKRSCAATSACGCRGRVFCQDRSSALTSRSMPPSR